MKVIITATAPTSYQLNSLRAFGINYKENGNGSFTATQEFNSKPEAVAFLKNRAEMYFEDSRELRDAKRDIRLGCLTLDAVTARIERLEKK